MRTTLEIDDDVLQAARELAERADTTIGRTVSDLIRKALEPAPRSRRVRNGVPVLPRRPGAAVLTLRRVNELRDE